MKETISKRTLTSRAFQKENGKRVFRFHSDHINYEKDGVLEVIDKSFIEVEGKVTTKATGFDLQIEKENKEGESPFSFGVKANSYGLFPRGLRWDNKEVVFQDSKKVSVKRNDFSAEYKGAFGDSDLIFETINTGVRKIVKINKPLSIPDGVEFLEVGFEILIDDDHDFCFQDKNNEPEVNKILAKLSKLDPKRLVLEKEGKYKEARELYKQQQELENDLQIAMVSKWDKDSDVRFSGVFQIRKGETIIYGRVPYVWGSDGKSQSIEVELRKRNGKLYFTKLLPVEFLKEAIFPVQTDATTSYYVGTGCGDIYTFNASFATGRSASSGDATSVNPAFDLYASCTKSGANYLNRRAFYPIDTSGIADSDLIDSATLKLYGYGKTNANTTDHDIIQTTQASTSTLVVGDFDQVGSTVSASKAISTISVSAYNDFALDATGVGWISKTGFTKLGARNSRDTDNSAPTGSNEFNCKPPSTAGTAQDPYLEVITTEVNTFIPKVIMF